MRRHLRRRAQTPITVVDWDPWMRSPRELAVDTLHSETGLTLDQAEEAVDGLLGASRVLIALAGCHTAHRERWWLR
jgi:hypothetical protein